MPSAACILRFDRRNPLCCIHYLTVLGVMLLAGCEEPAIPGGYTTISVTDTNVVAASDFAVAAHRKKSDETLKLITIKSAESQVVSGRNYKLNLHIEEAGKERRAIAVVYEPLDGAMQLTSWTWE